MPLPRDQDLTVTWPLINPPSFLPAGKPTRGTAECCEHPPPPTKLSNRGMSRAQASPGNHFQSAKAPRSVLLSAASCKPDTSSRWEKQRAHMQRALEYPSLSFAKIVSLAYTAAIEAGLFLRKMVQQLLKIFYFLCLFRGMVTRSISSCCFLPRNNQESPRVVLQQACCVWAQN